MRPLRVLSLQKGADTAGQAIRMKQAFVRYAPEWTFSAMTQPPVGDYIGYPIDLRWSNKTVKAMWDELDVVHVHNSFNTLHWTEARYRHHNGLKPSVLHHHGTQFRQGHEALLREQRERRAIGITSTLDLWLMASGELEWLPAPYDIDWLASLRRPVDDGTIRIATAPTNRQIKSTDAFEAAIKRLQADGYPVQPLTIEHATWDQCLAIKATADIFFDQVILGFGCNTIEAWGMGIPVVAGVEPDRAAAIGHPIGDVEAEYLRRFGELPYYPATEATIYDALRDMVESPELRATYAQRGQQHARRWHHDEQIVAQLQSIYHRAVEQFDMDAAA